ncbi:hypothetical protein SLE2022_058630 [Rubroshorea leprosula]
MAGICCPNPPLYRNWMTHQSSFNPQKSHGARCCSAAPGNGNGSKTPRLLKLAVSGVTQLLRLFSFSEDRRLDDVSPGEKDEILVSGVDDVLGILKADYNNAYFVTGVFTSTIYADDCIFEDPTIRFRGKQLYSHNLKLLLPFFDSPSIGLQTIEKGVNLETNFVLAKWRLRTYLKLPWRPLISIDGSTIYELDDKFMIVRHTESWNVSALEAVGQIFTPSFGSPND